MLAIVHRRQEAEELARRLGQECMHLSARMCAKHRTAVLAKVRQRLERGDGCQLVATQLVEAGVDLDFPVVFRALAGLETLAQAAGRCNREMRLPEPGRRASFDDGPYIHPMAPPEPAMSRPPIPPAAWAVEAPRRPGSAAPTRTEPSYRPRVEPRIDRTS